jgi:hypothetical protein
VQDTDLAKTVEELQKKVETLELRAQMTSRLFGRVGLDRFFGEPEFWENIVDVGQAECSQRCTQALQSETAAITANTNYTAAERTAKYKEATDRAAECHKRCQESFPIFP